MAPAERADPVKSSLLVDRRRDLRVAPVETLRTVWSHSRALTLLPFVGIYRASKAAVNAFTESLAGEMEPFGVPVRIVLPGFSGETRFREAASAGLRGMDSEVYGEFMRQAIARMRESTGPGTYSADVDEAVSRAATDPSSPMRIPASADAVAWAAEAS